VLLHISTNIKLSHSFTTVPVNVTKAPALATPIAAPTIILRPTSIISTATSLATGT